MKERKWELQASIGSIEARNRLILKSRRTKLQMDKNIGMVFIMSKVLFFDIDKIIKWEPDALHAVNLSKLLKKNWTEYPKAYKIWSKIPKSKRKRLQEILKDNRYYP